MNGAKYLPIVLKRIDMVIPYENINRRILVDDHSIDRTVEVAKDFNWEVYINPETGIPSGANKAFKHVEMDYFVSLEQDLVLAGDWWEKIPKYMEDEKVAVAQGIRLATQEVLRKLDEYHYSRIGKSGDILRDLIRLGGISLDNNIIRTKVIKELGGFPTSCPVCMDINLMRKIISETNYKWIMDKNVISDHIRSSIFGEARHLYNAMCRCANTSYCGTPIQTGFRTLLLSPGRGILLTASKRCPELFFAYPLIRAYKFKGQLVRRKQKHV